MFMVLKKRYGHDLEKPFNPGNSNIGELPLDELNGRVLDVYGLENCPD